MAATWTATSLQTAAAASGGGFAATAAGAAAAQVGESGRDCKPKNVAIINIGSNTTRWNGDHNSHVSLHISRADVPSYSESLRRRASCVGQSSSWSTAAEDAVTAAATAAAARAACSSSSSCFPPPSSSSSSSSSSFSSFSSSSSPIGSSSQFLAISSGNRYVATSAVISRPGFGGGGGTGLLERPDLNLDQGGSSPDTEEGGDLGKSPQKRRLGGGDRYRVLLLDHEKHTESQVANVLPSVVPSVSPDEARRCFQESREVGFAVVLVCVKEHAEFYAQMMARSGLRSSIEPDDGVL